VSTTYSLFYIKYINKSIYSIRVSKKGGHSGHLDTFYPPRIKSIIVTDFPSFSSSIFFGCPSIYNIYCLMFLKASAKGSSKLLFCRTVFLSFANPGEGWDVFAGVFALGFLFIKINFNCYSDNVCIKNQN